MCLQMKWTEFCGSIVGARIGHKEFHASSEALMLLVAIRTWITPESRGMTTLVAGAEGVLCDQEPDHRDCEAQHTTA